MIATLVVVVAVSGRYACGVDVAILRHSSIDYVGILLLLHRCLGLKVRPTSFSLPLLAIDNLRFLF